MQFVRSGALLAGAQSCVIVVVALFAVGLLASAPRHKLKLMAQNSSKRKQDGKIKEMITNLWVGKKRKRAAREGGSAFRATLATF